MYEQLKTFITLAEVKNFTKTAEILHLSQPSVSLHIKNLEKEFQNKTIYSFTKRATNDANGRIAL
ncbi:HTH-type transcriptional regulator CysL [Anoxybacillus sp. BCO1]|nr:HTH-type transcriptional regulator CysL [Anoxybacillus sp. BCO1]